MSIGHSPLGASGASRWMACPGSVKLSQKVNLFGEEAEEAWTIEGHIAHAAAAMCLKSGIDAWELVGDILEAAPFTDELVQPVQAYIDACRAVMYDDRLIEEPIGDTGFHKYFYGTVDFGSYDAVSHTLYVRDLKMGIGVPVSSVRNVQLMYYAYGLYRRLRHNPLIETINMQIIQPRNPHGGGEPYVMDAAELEYWAYYTLLPAMMATEHDDAMIVAGKHCQFCPAKIICPQLQEIAKRWGAEGEDIEAKVEAMPADQLAREFYKIAPMKAYIKAVEKAVTQYLNAGVEVGAVKLVETSCDRVWKEGADKALVEAFGVDKLFNPPKLKSPAQVEMLGSKAKALVQEWAYKPQGNLVAVRDDDKRPAVKVRKPSDNFSVDNLTKGK